MRLASIFYKKFYNILLDAGPVEIILLLPYFLFKILFCFKSMTSSEDIFRKYRVFHILPQISTENHATFPIQMYAIAV